MNNVSSATPKRLLSDILPAARLNRLLSMWVMILLALVSVGFSGCNITFNGSGTGLRGSGISKTETREVTSFDKIIFQGMGQVNVSYGDTDSLEIIGDDNLLELIETNVNNGKLTIRPTEGINPKIDLVFNIVTTDLSEVAVSGAANLDIYDAKGEELKIKISGAASMSGNGEITNLKVSISGAGSIDLEDLKTKNVDVSVSGAAKATVHASDSIDASISGVGIITCHGNPTDVKKSTGGLGKISIVE